MGWIANWKAKRAAEKAEAELLIRHADWESDLLIFDKALEVFTAALKGEDSVSNYVVQKSGEIALWTGEAVFHEVGRSPSRYEGSSSGVSIPIMKGVRYRVGATRGTLIPGNEYQMDKDQGTVLITTDRVIFTGGIKTQEWAFAKMLGAARSEDETDFNINVSNRQKTSGIRFNKQLGKEFNVFLALSMSAAEDGIPAVLDELREVKKNLEADEPKLEVTDNKPAELN